MALIPELPGREKRDYPAAHAVRAAIARSQHSLLLLRPTSEQGRTKVSSGPEPGPCMGVGLSRLPPGLARWPWGNEKQPGMYGAERVHPAAL